MPCPSAGADRVVAEKLFSFLEERELSVFYDNNEQHRILAENIEDYLAPIYRSEASFVIVLLGREYPKRVWTRFESEQFKERFGDKAIISVWFSDVSPGIFDETTKYGGIKFDYSKQLDSEIKRIGELLCQKIVEYKESKQALQSTGRLK